jgi:hypothetical protein
MTRDERYTKRVYAWEGGWADWCRRTMNLKQCREVVRWACEKYGVKPPRVTRHAGTAYSFSQGSLISFQADQQNAAIALHEAAHYICDLLVGAKEEHSREWLGIYLWLLEGWRIAPRCALIASARARRLRWAAPWRMAPSRIGKR